MFPDDFSDSDVDEGSNGGVQADSDQEADWFDGTEPAEDDADLGMAGLEELMEQD